MGFKVGDRVRINAPGSVNHTRTARVANRQTYPFARNVMTGEPILLSDPVAVDMDGGPDGPWTYERWELIPLTSPAADTDAALFIKKLKRLGLEPVVAPLPVLSPTISRE